MVGKHSRNIREVYHKLQVFQKVYMEQMNFIEQLFTEWPYEAGVELHGLREMDKREYLKAYMRAEGFAEDELLCVFEEYYGYKYRNYEVMIMGNTKITFLEREELKSMQILP
jgi:hypothetical protein